jgi:HPt (histidine-containing phosphotransfer) domain-containing protein
MEDQIVIDTATFQTLKELMGSEFLVELIDTYCIETADLIMQLQDAFQAGDSLVLGRLGHSIKSSSASMGALALSEKARELEMLGKAGDLIGAGPKLQLLTADFLAVRSCLEELRNES